MSGMQIQRVRLDGVGTLGQIDLTFPAQGISLVLGPNESGKSTLCEAIVATLYGCSQRGANERLRTWGRSEGQPHTGELWVQIDGCPYYLYRDLEDERVRLARLRPDGSEELLVDGSANPRGRTDEVRANCAALRRVLGLPGEELLRASTYLGQLAAEVEIDDELRQQITGAGQADYRSADAELTDQYYGLTRQPLPGDRTRSGEREIERLSAEIEALGARRREAERLVDEMGRGQKELEQHRQQQAAIEAELEPIRDEADALAAYLEHLDERATLDEQAALVQRHTERLERYQAKLEEARDRLEESPLAELAALEEAQRASLQRYVAAGAERDLERLAELEEQLERERRRLEGAELGPLAEAPEDTPLLIQRLGTCQEQIDALTQQATATAAPRQPVGTMALFGLVVGGLGLGVGLAIGMAAGSPGLYALVGFLLGAAAGVAVGRAVGIGRATASMARVQAQREVVQTEAAELARLLEPLRTALPDVEPDELAERWREWHRVAGEMAAIQREMDAIQQRESTAAARDPALARLIGWGSELLGRQLEAYQRALAHLEQAREQLRELEREPKPPAPDPSTRADIVAILRSLEGRYPTFGGVAADRDAALERLQGLKQQVATREARLRSTGDSIRRAELALAELRGARAEDPTVLKERIDWARERLVRLRLRRDALALAIGTLRDSAAAYEKEHLQRLGEAMAQYWAQFTNGQPDEGGWRYASVRIGAGHALQIQAAGGIELTPDQLSVGARDQLYLAMRLAVADVLAEDATLPLVLDDALVNYDAERRRRALTLLDQIAAERQVILLSHDAYYVEWAAQVHRLGDG